MDKKVEANTPKKWEDYNPKEKKKAKIILIVAAVLFLFLIGSISNAISGNNRDSNKVSPAATPSPTADSKPEPKKPDVPAEYKSALIQADSYANSMYMSKKGLYDQLVSEYGGQFSVKAAEYAITNVNTDWNANALSKAKTYQNDMHQSPAAIHDQLTSDYGEKFTQTEADYAIEHLND